MDFDKSRSGLPDEVEVPYRHPLIDRTESLTGPPPEEALRLARSYEEASGMKGGSISDHEAYEVYGALWTTPRAFRMARANLGVGLVCGVALALCIDFAVRAFA